MKDSIKVTTANLNRVNLNVGDMTPDQIVDNIQETGNLLLDAGNIFIHFVLAIVVALVNRHTKVQKTVAALTERIAALEKLEGIGPATEETEKPAAEANTESAAPAEAEKKEAAPAEVINAEATEQVIKTDADETDPEGIKAKIAELDTKKAELEKQKADIETQIEELDKKGAQIIVDIATLDNERSALEAKLTPETEQSETASGYPEQKKS